MNHSTVTRRSKLRSNRSSALRRLLTALPVLVGCGPTAAPPPPAALSGDLSQEPAAAAAPAVEDESVTVRRDNTPVTALLRLPRRSVAPGQELTVTVELRIAPLWEIKALATAPAANDAATSLELSLPPGVSAVGEWTLPAAARSMSPSGHSVYAGAVSFTRTLAIDASAPPGPAPVACRVSCQACNDRTCLKPQVAELSAPLTIIAP